MNDKVIVISKINESPCFIYFKDGTPQEFFYLDSEDYTLNSIYTGRIQAVHKNLNACFVDFASNATGFLPFSEMEPSLILNRSFNGEWNAGDEVAVQISSLSQKSKPYGLTMNLNIPGSLAVSTVRAGLSFSSKLNKAEKEALSSFLKGLKVNNGLIIRTNAKSAEKDKLTEEVLTNDSILNDIKANASKRTLFSCLYKGDSQCIKRIRDILADKIITDDKEIYKDLNDNLSRNFNIEFYEGSPSLSVLYKFNSVRDEAISKKVNLKSGAFLYIEATEALTVIDVNSGKCELNKSKADLTLKINEEAAAEICRLLMLRNLSGIIVIDFINMEREGYEKVSLLLKEKLKNDFVKAKFIDITPLGLCEITRQKTYRTIK